MISPCLVPHLRPHGAFPSKRYYPKSNGWMLGEKGKKRERESERRGEGERNAISPPTTASHRRKQFTDESNFISFALHKKRGNADIFLQTYAQRHSWDRNSFSCWQMRVGGLPKSDNKGECSVLQCDPERMVFRRESKFIKYSPAVPDKYWLFWGEVFVASLRDRRSRLRTDLSQQRAALLKNAGLQDYTRVTFMLAETWLRVMRWHSRMTRMVSSLNI